MDEWICKGLVCLFGYESKRAGAYAGEHICMQTVVDGARGASTWWCRAWLVSSMGSRGGAEHGNGNCI